MSNSTISVPEPIIFHLESRKFSTNHSDRNCFINELMCRDKVQKPGRVQKRRYKK